MYDLKKLGIFLLILLLFISLSGCSEVVELVNDKNSAGNPLSGKNTDERIIMCLEEEYPEHDFVVVESFNKENDFGKFEDENGIEFTVHGLVYDNTYHFGCRNDYLKVLLESQDYLNKVSDIAEEYGFNVDYSEETIGIEGDENKDSSDSIVRISEMIQKILNSVDTPQIMYPKEAGSFSTGEINYYSIPCWGQLTCLYHIQGHSAVMTFRFGDESITEENIQDIVTEAIEQTEKNIEEDELSKFQFVTLYLLFYHNSESVEIACFLSRFPTFRIYGTGGHLGVDLG